MNPPEPVQPRQNRLIRGRYWTRDPIGTGGLGVVFSGWDEELQRPVAIKRLNPQALGSDTDEVQIWNEARSLATLQHPNIVTLFDFGRDRDGVFFIMELLQGENLERYIERTRLAESDFLSIAHQALEGLCAAHNCGVLHLDIKPSNFIINRGASGQLTLKMLDFGLSRLLLPSDTLDTKAAQLMGTPEYVAPEQLRRQPVDVRTDLYSLGHVFYHALAGKPAFNHKVISMILDAHIREEPQRLHEVRPDISQSLCQWVHYLMRREPEKRPVSAAAALQDLNLIRENYLKAREEVYDLPLPVEVQDNPLGLSTADLLAFVDQPVRVEGVLELSAGKLRLQLKSIEGIQAPPKTPEERTRKTEML
jgi:serine/threonine protein kinase